MNKPRELQVKKITFENPDKIRHTKIEWKYDKKTKVLNIRIKKDTVFSHGEGFINITEATKNYNEWY